DVKDFTANEARQLQSYSKAIDELQPPILIAKRESMNLDEAAQGGATADFLGMGSANLRATAEGVAGKSSAETAIVGVREGEKRVTKEFQKRMEAFKKKVGGAVCSGDDCEMAKAMTVQEKAKLMQNLANDPKTKKVRMAFFQEGVPAEARR